MKRCVGTASSSVTKAAGFALGGGVLACSRGTKSLLSSRVSAAPTLSYLASTASAVHCQQYRFQSNSLSSKAIENVKGSPAISFTPYKVFHVICKHDPKLKGRQGPQLMAIVYNRYQRLWGPELTPYKKTAQKLNRLRSLASQRLLLSAIVVRKFGVENYRRIYPNSTVTLQSANRVVAASNASAAAAASSAASTSSSSSTSTSKKATGKKKAAKKGKKAPKRPVTKSRGKATRTKKAH